MRIAIFLCCCINTFCNFLTLYYLSKKSLSNIKLSYFHLISLLTHVQFNLNTHTHTYIGLSISPAHTRPTTTWFDSSSGRTRVPSSKTWCWRFGFASLPSKPVQPDLPEERTMSCDFKLSDKFSSAIWHISATKTPDPAILSIIWGKKHRIWRNLCQIQLDRTGSWTDQERSRQFSTFFVVSGGFWPHPKLHSPDEKPTRKPRP